MFLVSVRVNDLLYPALQSGKQEIPTLGLECVGSIPPSTNATSYMIRTLSSFVFVFQRV